MKDHKRHEGNSVRKTNSQQHQEANETKPPIQPEEAEESTMLAKPGASVNCLYGIGVVEEVRKCGTTKIKLKSSFPGRQAPTAYLMPEFYTVLPVAE